MVQMEGIRIIRLIIEMSNSLLSTVLHFPGAQFVVIRERNLIQI